MGSKNVSSYRVWMSVLTAYLAGPLVCFDYCLEKMKFSPLCLVSTFTEGKLVVSVLSLKNEAEKHVVRQEKSKWAKKNFQATLFGCLARLPTR